jgi:hypothetical protein
MPSNLAASSLAVALARRPRSYQPRLRLAIATIDSITVTSMDAPTSVTSAAPEVKPNRAIAVATADSKKWLPPISADGPASQCASPSRRLSRWASPDWK